jgi:hypothetical protein
MICSNYSIITAPGEQLVILCKNMTNAVLFGNVNRRNWQILITILELFLRKIMFFD